MSFCKSFCKSFILTILVLVFFVPFVSSAKEKGSMEKGSITPVDELLKLDLATCCQAFHDYMNNEGSFDRMEMICLRTGAIDKDDYGFWFQLAVELQHRCSESNVRQDRGDSGDTEPQDNMRD